MFAILVAGTESLFRTADLGPWPRQWKTRLAGERRKYHKRPIIEELRMSTLRMHDTEDRNMYVMSGVEMCFRNREVPTDVQVPNSETGWLRDDAPTMLVPVLS